MQGLFLLLGGGFILYQIARSGQTEFTPLSYKIDFDSGKAILLIKTRITNPGAISYTLDRINLQVFAGQSLVAQVRPDTQILVEAKSNNEANIPAVLKAAGILDTVANYKSLGRNLTIRGEVFINGIRKNVNEQIRP